MNLRSTALAAFFLSSSTFATTWTVDAAGGVGSDFTTISAAVAAASPGDVILVRPGAYAGFTVSEGIAILGGPVAPTITTKTTINAVPAGPRFTLAGMQTEQIVITNCAGAVTIEDVQAIVPSMPSGPQNAVIVVSNSADVRLRNVEAAPIEPGFYHGVLSTSSRLEIVDGTVLGAEGVSCGGAAPAAGGGAHGVQATTGTLHVARSNLTGGRGGNGCPSSPSPVGGAGGAGVYLVTSGVLLASGSSASIVRGGDAGSGGGCAAVPGVAVRVGSVPALVSGMSFLAGSGGCTPPPPISGPFTTVVPADPHLSFSGSPTAGGTLTFTVHGEPGHVARLMLGRQLAVVDVPTAAEDRLLVPLRTYTLGVLPASGAASFALTLPPTWPAGHLIVAQARAAPAGSPEAWTHSLAITAR